MNKYYNIGGLSLCLSCEAPIDTSNFFADFITEAAVPDITVNVILGPLPEIAGGVYATYPDEHGEQRYALRVKKAHNDYDLFVDYALGQWDSMLFLALDFSGLLLENHRVTCHCSYILREGEAVLFVGHKQVGKSTQAALWEQFGHAEIINGDRAVLMLDGQGHLVACGTPYCGSSKIAVNKSAPVKALVLLSQGPDNTITPITDKNQRLRAIMPHLNCNAAHLNEMLELAQGICTAAPFYRFSCRPDRDAVTVMEDMLWNQTTR